jgi:BlaI family transcriptional regulator, penicillinase repressor
MAPDSTVAGGSRHSILDLSPLELDCMNALWPSGEATVRQIQKALRPTRPRAYTTIMTILDRLAHKGIVQRRKLGRAWVYSPSVSAAQARTHAVSQVVEGFFGGSAGALASHLTAQSPEDIQVEGVWRAPAIPRVPPPAERLARSSAARNIENVPANPTDSSAPENLDPALL